jgi:signal transduction histidine kinase
MVFIIMIVIPMIAMLMGLAYLRSMTQEALTSDRLKTVMKRAIVEHDDQAASVIIRIMHDEMVRLGKDQEPHILHIKLMERGTSSFWVAAASATSATAARMSLDGLGITTWDTSFSVLGRAGDPPLHYLVRAYRQIDE